jgi:hypothetical protein
MKAMGDAERHEIAGRMMSDYVATKRALVALKAKANYANTLSRIAQNLAPEDGPAHQARALSGPVWSDAFNKYPSREDVAAIASEIEVATKLNENCWRLCESLDSSRGTRQGTRRVILMKKFRARSFRFKLGCILFVILCVGLGILVLLNTLVKPDDRPAAMESTHESGCPNLVPSRYGLRLGLHNQKRTPRQTLLPTQAALAFGQSPHYEDITQDQRPPCLDKD